MGQIIMWFTPFNKELERTADKAIIQKLMSWDYSSVGDRGCTNGAQAQNAVC